MCVCVSSYPLCVTRHWRSPSFLKISTVMSIGVWSVTVKGLRSMMHLSRRGGGASGGSNGVCSVKTTWEALTMPSWRLRALSERSKVGFVETKLLCIQKKTKKTTLWLDLCLHTSIIHTYWYEQISPEYKSHKPLGLRRDNHREATKVRALHQWLRINQETNVISIISIRIPNLFPRNIGVICVVVPPPPPQSCPPAWAQPARGPSSSASSRPPPGCCVQTLLLAPGTGIHSAWCEPAKHQEHAGITSPFLKGGGKKKPKQ